MNSDALRKTLRITKAVADLQRVRILMMLEPGELCVCQIVEVLALAPSTISKHLSILSGAGLVDFRKDGRWAYYRLPAERVDASVRPLLKWLGDALKGAAMIERDRKKLRSVVACDPGSLCRRQRKHQHE
jgi:ArsR family transcriptional regulator, arsenate/arsenite/antimonite-responsive transcriptional repressor